jgi:hypothetical protein
MNQEELTAFWKKMDSIFDITENWSKKLQKIVTHWQQGTHTEMLL